MEVATALVAAEGPRLNADALDLVPEVPLLVELLEELPNPDELFERLLEPKLEVERLELEELEREPPPLDPLASEGCIGATSAKAKTIDKID